MKTLTNPKVIIGAVLILLLLLVSIFLISRDQPQENSGLNADATMEIPPIAEPTEVPSEVPSEAPPAPPRPAVVAAAPATTGQALSLATPTHDFPTMRLTSDLDPFTQDRQYWHSATLTLDNHPNAFEETDVRLRGRGNSTWLFGHEKRPLRLRFETPQALLGSEFIARDWVLIANHFDLTLIRTHLAFYLGEQLDGLAFFAPATHLVHLYINDQYVGIYQVTDERDTDRMDLQRNQNPALSEFLFELDGNAVNGGTEGVDFFFVDERSYDIRYPRNNHLTPAHVAYMEAFVQDISEILRTRDYDQIRQVMDLESFIDFYLVQELFKNIDVGLNSVFMYVRGVGENRRMYWGPIWDFDRSAGNMLYWHDYEHLHAAVRNHFMGYLLTTPEIFDQIATRWAEISETYVPMMMARLQMYMDFYAPAFQRNFDLFPIWAMDPPWLEMMIPPHVIAVDTWLGQVEFLQSWFEGRIWWMNQFFAQEDPNLVNWWLNYLQARN